MKLNRSIDIHQIIETVTALFADPNNLIKYQDGFIKKELISGSEGENGAISMMYYDQGKNKIELKETVIENNLPHSFEGFYEHEHMDNKMLCTFEALNKEVTQYRIDIDYVRMSFMPKLMSFIFPGMFSKQVMKWMENFKRFAEDQ